MADEDFAAEVRRRLQELEAERAARERKQQTRGEARAAELTANRNAIARVTEDALEVFRGASAVSDGEIHFQDQSRGDQVTTVGLLRDGPTRHLVLSLDGEDGRVSWEIQEETGHRIHGGDAAARDVDRSHLQGLVLRFLDNG